MDQQQIHPGQVELREAFIERALKIRGREPVVIDLGGDKNVLAVEAGGGKPLRQPFPHLGLVAVTLGGVDMTIAQPQGGFHGVDADRALERHGSQADGRNPCAVGFDDIHYVLPVEPTQF